MELGSTVKLTYKGTTDDGEVFGYADADSPMEFQTGLDLVIDGLEKEILKLEKAGDKATFTVSQYDAYGEYFENLIEEAKRETVPIAVEPGKRIWMMDGNGAKNPATVLEVTDDIVKVDLNHPLAGHDLTFEVELLEVNPPPENFVSAAERKKEADRLKHLLGQ